MKEVNVKVSSKRKEVVLHYQEIISILKKHVADRAASFLDLSYKQEDESNIVCLDETSLVIPSDGLHFASVESPVDYK